MMKARVDAILQREQAEYLDQLLPQTDRLLTEMEAYAAKHQVPIADREVAAFIEITARVSGAKRALEIGMAIGYSVIHLARGMGEGSLVVTIEPSDEMIEAASGYFERARLSDGTPISDRVRVERGKALDVMPRLAETFDLLFIDAVKEEYKQYLDLGLQRLRSGGVVIVDNLLWGGKVAGSDTEASTVALREFNPYFINHPQLRAVVLPVGDGLGYAVKY
jgi:predicted O-methyltransferase YrrM